MKALQQKKEKEEKEQEKAQFKREAHKAVLKKAKDLLSRTVATSTVVRAEDVPSPFETLPEPSTSRQIDPLETSLVESGPQLLSLDPFEEEEEEMIRPTSTGAARVTDYQCRKYYYQTPKDNWRKRSEACWSEDCRGQRPKACWSEDCRRQRPENC